jgi:hypothetical protein
MVTISYDRVVAHGNITQERKHGLQNLKINDSGENKTDKKR